MQHDTIQQTKCNSDNMQHEFDWSILLIYETNTIRLWRKQRVGATVAHLHYCMQSVDQATPISVAFCRVHYHLTHFPECSIM